MKLTSIIVILLLIIQISCSNSDEKSIFESLAVFFLRKNRVTISGNAIKGIVRKAEVNIYKVNQDGTCDTNSLLGFSNTDDNGDYSVIFNKGNGLVCVVISPNSDGTTEMFDEKTLSYIPISKNSTFKLTNIISEEKINATSREKNLVSPFSRFIAKRFSALMLTANGKVNPTLLNQKASKETVIRFGLFKGLSESATREVGLPRNSKPTFISSEGYPEHIDLNLEISNLNNPLSAKYISILSGFSYLASKYKKGNTLTIEDLDSTIDSFALDFEDGIFDGKGIDGKQVYLGTEPNRIALPNDSLTNLLLPAIKSFFSEGGKLNIGQNSTVGVAKGSLDQIEFLDTIPIILGINFPNRSYTIYKNNSIANITPQIENGVTSCEASPSLPTGLIVSSSCEISGTPTTTQSSKSYFIIGSKSNGNKIFTEISIKIENLNSLYVLNPVNQTVSAFQAFSDGTLTLREIIPTSMTASMLLWNGKHIILGGGTNFRSYFRNSNGTLNFANSFVAGGFDFRGYGNPSVHPNGGSLFSVENDHNIGKIQIDSNGNFSNPQNLNIPNWDVITPINPSGSFIVTQHQSAFGQSITQVNASTGALSGVVGGSGSFVTTPFYNDLGSCVYSSNGVYLYCTSNSSLVTTAGNAGVKQFSVTSSSVTALSTFTVPVEFGVAMQGPKDLVLHQSGNYIFVFGTQNIFAFNVNTTTGIINPTPINSVPAPGSCGLYTSSIRMAIHPEGSFLYAPCHTNGQIGVYPINSNGSLGTPSIGATTTAINTGFSGHTLLFVSGN